MDKLSLSLYNSPSMKLEDFRGLSVTALSLKNVRNMKMAPLRISGSAFPLIPHDVHMLICVPRKLLGDFLGPQAK